jgi:hypothetical protein
MSEYQLTQTKERIAALLAEINEKTDEVERLVKEEKCLVEKEKLIVEEEKHIVEEDNTSMQDILAKIICAEENYKAAQMAYTKAIEDCGAASKVYNDQCAAIRTPFEAFQKKNTEDELEVNKAFYAAYKEAQQKLTEAEMKVNKIQQIKFGLIEHPIINTEDLNKQLQEANIAVENAKTKKLSAQGTLNSKTRSFYNDELQQKQNVLSNKLNYDNTKLCESEAYISLNTASTEQTKAKALMADALQKYEIEKLNFFKAHLTDTVSDIEWKRSNFEMVDNMLKQITVLQACEEKQVEEKRAEEKCAEEKRAEEKQAEEKRAEEKRDKEKRAEEKRAEENRKNFEKVEIMIKQIAVLQNWMNETKIREEKRANAIEAFLEERHKF